MILNIEISVSLLSVLETRVPISSLFNTVLEALANKIRKQKR